MSNEKGHIGSSNLPLRDYATSRGEFDHEAETAALLPRTRQRAALVRAFATACLAAPHTLWGTRQTVVDLGRATRDAEAVACWEAALARGGAGVVVRPLNPGSDAAGGPLAPVLKCRSEDALRLVHGPEYTPPEHRERLRGPEIDWEADRAAREWALSVEALERFIGGDCPARVHECVFGAMAVKSGSRAWGSRGEAVSARD